MDEAGLAEDDVNREDAVEMSAEQGVKASLAGAHANGRASTVASRSGRRRLLDLGGTERRAARRTRVRVAQASLRSGNGFRACSSNWSDAATPHSAGRWQAGGGFAG